MLCATTLAAIAVLHRALQPGRDEETEQEHQTWPTPVPNAGPLGINSRHRIPSHDDTETQKQQQERSMVSRGFVSRLVWTAAGWTSNGAAKQYCSCGQTKRGEGSTRLGSSTLLQSLALCSDQENHLGLSPRHLGS